MNTRNILWAIIASVVVGTGCEVFVDQSPEFITMRMTGPAGETVSMVYSKDFVAGVNEVGVTEVRLFSADTVVQVLPIDTIIDVRAEQRIYIAAQASDTIAVDVRVDVDGRSLFDDDGDLFPTFPWQFLYQFNQLFTDNIEIVI